jgi:hypothetical protein
LSTETKGADEAIKGQIIRDLKVVFTFSRFEGGRLLLSWMSGGLGLLLEEQPTV